MHACSWHGLGKCACIKGAPQAQNTKGKAKEACSFTVPKAAQEGVLNVWRIQHGHAGRELRENVSHGAHIQKGKWKEGQKN